MATDLPARLRAIKSPEHLRFARRRRGLRLAVRRDRSRRSFLTLFRLITLQRVHGQTALVVEIVFLIRRRPFWDPELSDLRTRVRRSRGDRNAAVMGSAGRKVGSVDDGHWGSPAVRSSKKFLHSGDVALALSMTGRAGVRTFQRSRCIVERSWLVGDVFVLERATSRIPAAHRLCPHDRRDVGDDVR